MSRLTKSKAGIAGLAITGLVMATVPGLVISNANWTDNEWVSASLAGEPGVGTLDCEVNDIFSTRGAGRYLSGELLNFDLDAIASIEGVVVTNDGTTATATPPTATALGDDAFANPLTVTALDAINLQLSGLLLLPLGNSTGVVNQYGQAVGLGAPTYPAGYSVGAAGAVNDSGGIALTPEPPGPSVPTVAQISLDTLLENAVGEDIADIVSDLAGLDLTVGAVASSAILEACPAAWDGTQAAVYDNLIRDYLVSGMSTSLESPLLGDLVTAVNTAVGEIETLVNGVASDDALLDDILDGVLGELGPLLGALGLGTPSITASAAIDLSAVQTLLTTPITDANGVFSIDLGASPATITINIAALFDSVNGLNNQAPNTQVLIDGDMINDLSLAVATALTEWVGDLEGALDDAVNAVDLTIDIAVPLTFLAVEAGTLDIALTGTPSTLALDSTFTCTNPGNVVGCATGATLSTTVDLAGPAIALVVQGIVAPVIAAPLALIVDTLILALPALTAPIVIFLGNALGALFGEDGLVSLVLNAQNAPDPAEDLGYPEPGWAPLDPFVAAPFETGRYDVSALRLVVLGTADTVEMDLARASVGSNALN